MKKTVISLLLVLFVNVVSGQSFVVKHIDSKDTAPEDVPGLFARCDVNYSKIANANWPLKFPYRPDVSFALAYTDEAILVHYIVNEDDVRAFVGKDHGPVWSDSCVEIFMLPSDDGQYYNFECNCLGYIHMAVGERGPKRTGASQEVLAGIKRWASLGKEPFGRKTKNTTWEVALVIPYSSFFQHDVKMVSGSTMKANAFKCGGTDQYEHYLSLFPIIYPKPNFHLSEFFQTFLFE